MSYNESKIKEENKILEEKIDNDRGEWVKKLNTLVNKIKNIEELAESQVLMLSYRQSLLDKVVDFKTTIFKRNSIYDKYYKQLYRKYTLDYDVKLSNTEKKEFIKADLSELKYQINVLENHVEFYNGCIKTLDNAAFAIRNRIRLDDEQI